MAAPSVLTQAHRKSLEELCATYDQLAAKGVLTAEESKSFKDLPNQMDAIKTELDSCIAADRKAAEIKGFVSGNGTNQVVPISNRTAQVMEQHNNGQALLDKAFAAKTQWLERVGTELAAKTAFGKLSPIESEGWGVSTKTWEAVCEPTYVKCFDKFLRIGVERMSLDEMKTLNEGSDGQGGFLVPPQFFARLIARKPYPTRILEYVETVPCSSDRVLFPRINFDSDTADIFSASNPRMQWIGEQGPTPQQGDMGFGNVEIPVYVGQFYVEVGRNLTEDSVIPMDQIVERFARQAYELGMDQVITVGDGNGKPTGILTNAGNAGLYCPTVNCGNPITANGLTQLVYNLPPQYSDGEKVAALMNRTSGFASFAQITDASGQYIFGLARDTGPGGMAMARQPVLFGFPVIFSAFMPNVGAAATPVAFGDWTEVYTFCQRVGLSVEAYGTQDRSMLQANKVGWLFRFRAGGMVTQNRAAHVAVQQ